jgi:hypothetical protein
VIVQILLTGKEDAGRKFLEVGLLLQVNVQATIKFYPRISMA